MTTSPPSPAQVAHTALPWKVGSVSMSDGAIGITALDDRLVIAYIPNGAAAHEIIFGRDPATQFANARLIVRAVNSHDAVVEALRSAREYFDQRSEADHNGHKFIANEAMQLCMQIDEALSLVGHT